MKKRILIALTAIVVGATPGMVGAGVEGPCGGGLESDPDNDTVPSCIDNCLIVPNGHLDANNQCDTDGDGYGNSCDFDVNQDNIVGLPDFGSFTANFGKSGHPINAADANCDGIIGLPDWGVFTKTFGGSVGPSGHSCAGTVPCP